MTTTNQKENSMKEKNYYVVLLFTGIVVLLGFNMAEGMFLILMSVIGLTAELWIEEYKQNKDLSNRHSK